MIQTLMRVAGPVAVLAMATVLLPGQTTTRPTSKPTSAKTTTAPSKGSAAETQQPREQQIPGVPIRGGFITARLKEGDFTEYLLANGVVYQDGDLLLRANRGVLYLDRDETFRAIRRGTQSGLPRRNTRLPDAKRKLSPEAVQQRLNKFLGALGQNPANPKAGVALATRLFRSLYLEGEVTIEQAGVEVLRASSIYFSPFDDRAMFRDVVLRVVSLTKTGRKRSMVLRGKKLVRQGRRSFGRDVTVTTDPGGKPQFAVKGGELEIIEHPDDLQIRSRDNTLVLLGAEAVPLPDINFFAREQSQVPIQGVRVGYSNVERAFAKVDFGSTLNETGGVLHNWLTGRDASEFRGDWRFGVGYNEARGYPLDTTLRYQGGDLYEGTFDAYMLNDLGMNIREITRNFDNTLIEEESRSLIKTENRVWLDDKTKLDLSLFHASDPAVFSEFYRDRYTRDEIPETSLVLRRADDNHLLSLIGRWDVNKFSYTDARTLAPGFVEELPSATYDVFSEPLADLPGDGVLEFTTSTGIGQRRTQFDETNVARVGDRTFRVDQQVELAASWHLGPVGIRPYTNVTGAYYDNSVGGDQRGRFAFETGMVAGTRLGRTFQLGGDDNAALHHSIHPTVRVLNRFAVSGKPGDIYQHDDIDALDERAAVRVGLLQRLQRAAGNGADRKAKEVLWVDLVQTLFPVQDRDNTGKLLGLFEYEIILRPLPEWAPVPNLRVLFEGEHDWDTGELRTLNTAFRFGPTLGFNWNAQYRTDSTVKGAFIYSADTFLFGRWQLGGGGVFDLTREQHTNYSANIRRRDRNWILTFGVSYDTIASNFSYNINFEPSFGGLFRTQEDRGFTLRGVDAVLDG